MMNVKLGDMAGVMGMVPVYTGWKAKFLAEGLTESEAELKAMEKFEVAIDRSQQTQSNFGRSAL
ncbi:hypothetical protein [Sinomicrobium sp. M5D2P17]